MGSGELSDLQGAVKAAAGRVAQLQGELLPLKNPLTAAYRLMQDGLLSEASSELDSLSGKGQRSARTWPFGQAARQWSLNATEVMDSLTIWVGSGVAFEVRDFP